MVMSIKHYYNVIRAFDIKMNKYLIFLKIIIYYLIIQTFILIGIHHHTTSSEITNKKNLNEKRLKL